MEATLLLPMGNNSAPPRNSPWKRRTGGYRVTHMGLQANPITAVVSPTTQRAPGPCRKGTWRHPEDRKGNVCTFSHQRSNLKFCTPKCQWWLKEEQDWSNCVQLLPSTLPVSNYFQLRGFPVSNVVCLFILLLPPNVFLFQVLFHNDFK